MIDWKKVAGDRLRQLRDQERWRLNMRAELYASLRKYLIMSLHGQCISNAERLGEEIARQVAKWITEK